MKHVVVVYIIDVSKSMEGSPIVAVNNALTETIQSLSDMKNAMDLDIQVAVMSFALNAKWELKRCSVDDAGGIRLRTRAGGTFYSSALKLLNLSLVDDDLMKFQGKRAAPIIVFMTDGESEEDRAFLQRHLNELQGNPWFACASRKAVLVGDVAFNKDVSNSICDFVVHSSDIITSSDLGNALGEMNIQTIHAVQNASTI